MFGFDSFSQSKQAHERISIPKIYHPFICGGFNETLNQIIKETNVRINVPPPSVQNDEIAIAGEKEGVQIAKEKIMKIYKEMVSFPPSGTLLFCLFWLIDLCVCRKRSATPCRSRCRARSTNTLSVTRGTPSQKYCRKPEFPLKCHRRTLSRTPSHSEARKANSV